MCTWGNESARSGRMCQEFSYVGSRQETPRISTKCWTRGFIIGTRHHVLRDQGQCSPYSGWLRAGYVRFRGLITGRGKRFLSSVKCPDRVSDPFSLLFFSHGVKFSRYEIRHSPHLVPKLRISGITDVPPLPLCVSMTCTGTSLPENGPYSSFVTWTRNKSGGRVFGKGVANIMTPQTTLVPWAHTDLRPSLP